MTPWSQCPSAWESEAAFWNYIRSGLRKIWGKHPVKTLFVQKYRVRVPNPNPDGRNETVFGMLCSRCGGGFPMPVAKKVRLKIEKAIGKPFNYIEINHRHQAGSLKTKEDLGDFAGNLLFVVFDDLEPICKLCHSTVTHAQKRGISEEEAAVEKEALFIIKTYGDKEWLLEKEIIPAASAAKRRAQIIEYLKEKPCHQEHIITFSPQRG